MLFRSDTSALCVAYKVAENTAMLTDPDVEPEPVWYHTGWDAFDIALTSGFAAFNSYSCNVYCLYALTSTGQVFAMSKYDG